MKRMPSKAFQKLEQRLRREKGIEIIRPYPRRQWHRLRRQESCYQLYRERRFSADRIMRIVVPTQADVIRWARHFLDGAPRPSSPAF